MGLDAATCASLSGNDLVCGLGVHRIRLFVPSLFPKPTALFEKLVLPTSELHRGLRLGRTPRHFSNARIMVKVAYTVGRFQPPTIGHKMLIQSTIDEAKKAATTKDGEVGPWEAYVFVSSAQGKGKEAARNPLTAEQKIPLLKHMFPKGVTFINTATDCDPKCGGPGAAFVWLKDTKKVDPANIVFVVGKERLGDDIKSKDYFGTEAPLWGGDDKPRPGAFVPVGHTLVRDILKPANDQENMSGTKARSYVKEDNSQKADFYTALGYDPKTPNPDVESVYDRIYAVKFGAKKGGDEEEAEEIIPTTLGPDGEPPAGGRRKTRRKRRLTRLTRLTRNRASSKALYRRGSRSRTGS
jgi:hypothetical protein